MARTSARTKTLSCALASVVAACGVAPSDAVVKVRVPAVRPYALADAPTPAPAVVSKSAAFVPAMEAETVASTPAQAAERRPAPAEAGVVVQRADPRLRERALRDAFACADLAESAAEALELAAFLVSSERHAEALHVLDVAIAAAPRASLLVGRAGVLRDLARNDLAWADLLSVVQSRGRDGIAPGTLFELAQVEWLAGASSDAQQTMRDLWQLHADSDWLVRHADEVRAWQERVESRDVTQDGGDMRDALALLRAAPQVTARLKMLDALAEPEPEPGRADAERRQLRLLALGIACGDEAPAVRARAVQLADEHDVADARFWAAALQDPAPLVRRFGARGAGRVLGGEVAPTLLAAICREADPAAFGCMNAALAAVLAQAAPAGDYGDAEARARICEEWRSRCGG